MPALFAYVALLGAASAPRRQTTLWINHAVPANIRFAQQHAKSLTRVIPAFSCWTIADNGTVSTLQDSCGPSQLAPLQKLGLEIWPNVVVSDASMLSGSWKPQLAKNGVMGLLMRKWGWDGIVLDLEESKDNRACRTTRCGSPTAKNCTACVQVVSAEAYTSFLAEFSLALKQHKLGYVHSSTDQHCSVLLRTNPY